MPKRGYNEADTHRDQFLAKAAPEAQAEYKKLKGHKDHHTSKCNAYHPYIGFTRIVNHDYHL
jgi:hypothetical protein